jgi:hypothetical protein
MLSFLSFFDELDDEPTQTRVADRRSGARALRDRVGDRVGGFGGGRGGGNDGTRLRRGGGRPSGPQLQRLAALAVGVLIVVVGGLLYLRSCQRDREVESYRTFVEEANEVTQSSNQAGRQFSEALLKRGQTSKGMLDALDAQIRTQDQAVQNARALRGPDAMEALTPQLVEAMQFRKNGLEGLRETMSAAFESVKARKLPLDSVYPVTGMYARLMASDVVYADAFQAPAKDALSDKDVTGVNFEDSTFIGRELLSFASPAGMQARLLRIHGGGAAAGAGQGGTAAGGAPDGLRHGTSIESVTFNPGAQALEGQRDPIVLNLGTENDRSTFSIVVENGGETQETGIEVSVVLGEETYRKNIVVIEAGETQTIDIEVEPEPREYPLVKVNVEPVENETRAENNTRTFKNVLFQVPAT